MDLSEATAWTAQRSHGTLITLRADGRAQSSDIVFAVDDGSFLISVTDDRAKTVNMRRDPRVVLHVSDPDQWSYVSFDGTATLSAVTNEPGDAASDALLDYYNRVSPEPHPDPDEYRQAMVDEKRLVVTFTPTSAVGIVRS
ncbi:MAG: PPOX class F420-dependent oxidoreductase [Acidimicrobiia bacterium]